MPSLKKLKNLQVSINLGKRKPEILPPAHTVVHILIKPKILGIGSKGE